MEKVEGVDKLETKDKLRTIMKRLAVQKLELQQHVASRFELAKEVAGISAERDALLEQVNAMNVGCGVVIGSPSPCRLSCPAPRLSRSRWPPSSRRRSAEARACSLSWGQNGMR